MQDNPFTREVAEFDKSYRIAYLIAGFIQENLSPAERKIPAETPVKMMINLSLVAYTNIIPSLNLLHRPGERPF